MRRPSPTPPDKAGTLPARRLLDALVLTFLVIIGVSVISRALLDPALLPVDLPIAAVGSFVVVLLLNRTRHHQLAAFLFCLAPVWLNVVEGLRRPDGPVWYGLLPMAAILGSAFLRFRLALLLAIAGTLGALLVVVLRVEILTSERGSLIVMYVALMNSAALGMAVFRERVERARQREVDRLAGQLAATERLESIGRLAGGVAHDFNNLLTVILGSAELARAGELRALDDLENAALRAAALTRQLLAFSRNRAAVRQSVDVDESIRVVGPLLRRLLPESVAIELHLAAPGSVLLEDQQLEQILFNLFANAQQAMPQGGRLTLQTETLTHAMRPTSQPGEFIVITVEDTGSGMDAETRAHAFEAFFTTKAAGEGTGLGLATVHGIVQQAGGWVELDSAPGAGTRVRIGLPIASRPSPPAPAPAVQSEGRLSGLVLVVEDEAPIRRVITRMLSDMGLSVISADGPEAVEAVLADAPGPISLLVTDVVMPGRSGVELVEALRARQPDLPVVFVSGYAEHDLQPALRQPATLFVAKPFTKAVLTAAVGSLLGGAASLGPSARPAQPR